MLVKVHDFPLNDFILCSHRLVLQAVMIKRRYRKFQAALN